MYQLPCSLCRDQIDCKNGELTKLKKHIKTEHDIVKYKVDLILALSCISPSEEVRFIELVQKRLVIFQNTGIIVTDENIFDEKAANEADTRDIKKDVEAIQKMISDDISDEEEEHQQLFKTSRHAGDEIMLLGEPVLKNVVDDQGDDDVVEITFEGNGDFDRCIDLSKDANQLKQEPGESPEVSNETQPSEICAPLNDIPGESLLSEVDCKMEVEEGLVILLDDYTSDELETTANSAPFCRLCYVTFSDQREQLPHEQKVHNTTEDREALKIEVTQLTLKDFTQVCKICSSRFRTKNSVSHHEKIEHRVGVEKSTNCKTCRKMVKTSKLRVHMQSHLEKKFKCKLCYRRFPRNKYLLAHEMLTHKDEAELLTTEITEKDLKHNCNHCELKFITKQLLDRHAKDHEEKQQLRMKECKLCYRECKYLAVHEKTVHKNDSEFVGRNILDSELLYKCSNCDKKFVKESIKMIHQKRHKEHREKQQKRLKECKLCYKECKYLAVHEKTVHKNDFEYFGRNILDHELVYKCSNCDKKFVKESIKLIHQKRHELEKFEFLRRESCFRDEKRHRRYKCKFCYMKHDKFCFMVAHIQLHHKTDINRISEKIITSELAFFCKTCDLGFISEDVLAYHNKRIHKLKIHTNVTKSVQPTEECKQCPQNFSQYSSLRRHYKANHNLVMPMRKTIAKIKKEPLTCKLCHILFETRIKYNEHIKCNHKRFKDEMMAIEALQKEKEINLTSECKFCHKGLLNRHVLTYHYGKVHREQEQKKIWKCDFCKKEFKADLHKRTLKLTQHMREDHDLEDYHFAEAKGANKIKDNKAKQNYQLILAKMLGMSK